MQLHEVLEFAAVRAPDTPALVDGSRSWTFAALRDRAARVAAATASCTEPGDRVAILSENTGEYVECYYGVPQAGRVLVLLNYRQHAREWVHMLQNAGACVLVVERDLLNDLRPHLSACPDLTTIVCTDATADGAVAYEAWLADARPLDPGVQSLEAGDVAWLIYTSGTTGRPKGAMLTHRNLLAAVNTLALGRPVADDDVYLFPFPLCHVAGFNLLLYHLFGRPVVLMRRFDAEGVLTLIAEHRITICSLAPTMIDVLCEHPALASADLSSLRMIGYGASGIPAPVLQRAFDRLGCDLSQGYGMTELAGNCAYLDADAHRRAVAGDARLLRGAGWASPLISMRVVDDDGRDRPAGEAGEIVVRGDQVCPGYWNDPEATAAAWRDGWFHTGDLGRIDADGLLTVVDRKKDIIVSGGENVASREVEEALLHHPAVREVAVVGVADDRWGEAVCALVVRADGSELSADDLIAHSRRELAGYKKPRYVFFVDALAKNTTGKVMKPELRELAEALRNTSVGGS